VKTQFIRHKTFYRFFHNRVTFALSRARDAEAPHRLLPYAANQTGCFWTGENPSELTTLTTLTDLRIATPFTFAYTAFESDCGSYSFTEWRTAFVRGTSYPGGTVTYEVVSPSANVSCTFTFQDLLLTDLLPGDFIAMVNCTSG
jgi:hypothetical protein